MIAPQPDLIPPSVVVLFPKGLEQITPEATFRALGLIYGACLSVLIAARYVISFFRNLA